MGFEIVNVEISSVVKYIKLLLMDLLMRIKGCDLDSNPGSLHEIHNVHQSTPEVNLEIPTGWVVEREFEIQVFL